MNMQIRTRCTTTIYLHIRTGLAPRFYDVITLACQHFKHFYISIKTRFITFRVRLKWHELRNIIKLNVVVIASSVKVKIMWTPCTCVWWCCMITTQSLLIDHVGRRVLLWGGFGMMGAIMALLTITLQLKVTGFCFTPAPSVRSI